MYKHKKKTPLIVSFCLLGGALVLLSGCSWENEPAAKEKESNALALDKLKTETPPQETPATAKKPAPQPKAPPTMNKPQYPTPPAMQIDASKTYTATLDTDKGKIVVALNAKDTPKTANNFIFLAREKFYDGTIFHRTIPGFMIQGGDPMGTGMGGPGYTDRETPLSDTAYSKGVIAMAKKGNEPAGTFGSQFFIMHSDYPLPADYVTFGQVTEGLEVIDAIATAPTESGGEGSKPVTPVVVKTVTIEEK